MRCGESVVEEQGLCSDVVVIKDGSSHEMEETPKIRFRAVTALTALRLFSVWWQNIAIVWHPRP